ncbi:helix-turn-helix transcriptional regulator [Streptomyces albipurpureus]|uniref:Helix-turn-helix transcriptional regulator n=1 Tax=Streptomyces albipurpureus TaxID=2897419 RepID=A0ABT0UHS4_9ACTN|nr:helix-turn-helix transcriptional regulator [Streptomyces sp. CWNU-1]MCM2388182.1 helix-turn-helix transcriptional regulator [Streptomyces sp. CWNU-1]
MATCELSISVVCEPARWASKRSRSGAIDPHARSAPPDILLERVLSYARTHLTRPDLTPAAIAAAHGISLRGLYRLCSRSDISLEQWLIEQRLEGARRTLSAPNGRTRPIGAAAHAWGFRDASHFARRFREAYGVTPRAWQRTPEPRTRPGQPDRTGQHP